METPGRTRNDAINARRCNSHPTHTGVERRDRNSPTNVRAVDNEPRYGPRPPRDTPVNTRTAATTCTCTAQRLIFASLDSLCVFKTLTLSTRRVDHDG